MPATEPNLVTLMKSVLDISYKSVTKRHTKSLNYGSRKYSQLRLMGIAHAMFRDMIIVCNTNKSARSLELLHRPLIEIWVNFLWIGLGNNNKNYVLYVIDDNLRMAKHVDYIIKYLRKTNTNQKEIDDWLDIKKLNLEQAEDAKKSTKFKFQTLKLPSIAERAREIDVAYPSLDGSMEWMILYPFSFAHRVIHSSNSQLNRLGSNDDKTIDILGSNEELDRAASECLLTFMGLLDDFGRVFKIPTKLDKLWESAKTAKVYK
ncbi:MAG: DUF5677 domain-containing protein [Candidatus Saccharimonadales bacterium]